MTCSNDVPVDFSIECQPAPKRSPEFLRMLYEHTQPINGDPMHRELTFENWKKGRKWAKKA